MFNETTYYDGNLGALIPTLVGTGGSIGGSIVGGMIGGSWGGPIGAGIGLISGLIAGIFGAHGAKVKREDEISNAWAANGPKAIDAVMASYRAGSISGAQAIASLDSIEQEFRAGVQQISKYNGKFGAFPDPEGSRPPNNCNWGCGTSWDLHQQIKGLKAQISTTSTGAASLGSLGLPQDPVILVGLGIVAYMLLK